MIGEVAAVDEVRYVDNALAFCHISFGSRLVSVHQHSVNGFLSNVPWAYVVKVLFIEHSEFQ